MERWGVRTEGRGEGEAGIAWRSSGRGGRTGAMVRCQRSDGFPRMGRCSGLKPPVVARRMMSVATPREVHDLTALPDLPELLMWPTITRLPRR